MQGLSPYYIFQRKKTSDFFINYLIGIQTSSETLQRIYAIHCLCALLYVHPYSCPRSIVHRHQRLTKPDRQSFLHQFYKHTAEANVKFPFIAQELGAALANNWTASPRPGRTPKASLR